MFTIGKVASQTELSTNALRFYEREGLICPVSKSPSGYRLYGADTVTRLKFIKQAQHCGFTLNEIGELLNLRSRDSACCSDVRRLAVEKKLQLDDKIRMMQGMSEALGILIEDCSEQDRPIADCPILGAMAQLGERNNKVSHGR